MKRLLHQRIYLAILACCLCSLVKAQDMTVDQYVATYKNLAIAEMQRTGVPASITLAQGILETEGGNSDLLKASNNHFGIKCKSSWTGATVSHDDDAQGECFRKYNCAADSYRDHSEFLKGGDRYASLFQLDPLDYKGWAYGLKKAGYATNPKYAQILIQYVEQYHLQDYCLIALGRMQDPDASLAAAQSAAKAAQVLVTKPAPVVHYPAGEFRINETRVVFAASGTSLLALADQYHISLSNLVDFNDLKNDNELQQDQLVYVQRKRKVGQAQYHTVAAGEVLYNIAQAEGIRLSSLLEYNQLDDESMQPAPGESLYLQGPSPSRPRLLDSRALNNITSDDLKVAREVSGSK
jgi:LysM repeat protein